MIPAVLRLRGVEEREVFILVSLPGYSPDSPGNGHPAVPFGSLRYLAPLAIESTGQILGLSADVKESCDTRRISKRAFAASRAVS